MGLVLLDAPAEPIVSVEEAEVHVRGADPSEADLLESLVAAATTQAETFCRRRFVSQRWRLLLDTWPTVRTLRIPYPPLASVESVKYVDGDGVVQTLAADQYVVRTAEVPGEIWPAYGVTWPTPRSEPDAVRVEFTCGYGAAEDVPQAIKRAVLLIVGTLYMNRETVAPVAMQPIPHAAEYLLGPYRVLRF